VEHRKADVRQVTGCGASGDDESQFLRELRQLALHVAAQCEDPGRPPDDEGLRALEAGHGRGLHHPGERVGALPLVERLEVDGSGERVQVGDAGNGERQQQLIREMILQLKTGSLDTGYFLRKFAVDVWQEFQPVYERLNEEKLLGRNNGMITLTRRGLLEVEQFLWEFFEPELKTVRYA